MPSCSSTHAARAVLPEDYRPLIFTSKNRSRSAPISSTGPWRERGPSATGTSSWTRTVELDARVRKAVEREREALEAFHA
jgi:hypothetical protein